MDIVYFILQQTIIIAMAICLVSLGAMFSERSGIINIALEGIMVFGAFAGMIFINIMQSSGSSMNPQIVYVLSLVIAAIAGVIISLLLAVASINLKADQTIGGTAINMIAPALAIFIARSINNTSNISISNNFFIKETALSGIPFIGDIFFSKTYISVYIAFAIWLISTVVLYKTRFGLRLMACGEHPQAADSVGINVKKMRYLGVIISGFLGGLGGMMLISVSVNTYSCTVNGFGFLAIAVMIFGQWKPGKILLSSLFFALMMTISSTYSVIPFLNNLGIPGNVYKMLPYIATLVVLAFTSKKSKAPKAEGIPYDKGMR